MGQYTNYLNNLLSMFNYKTTKTNISNLFKKIVEEKSIKLWSGSQNNAEFTRLSRLLDSSDLKNTLNNDKISEALLKNAIKKISDKDNLLIVHDQCDIRKEYSQKLEDLGKVRNLEGKIVNGYSSFNSIAIDFDKKDVTLLDSKIFSNKSDDFISQSDIKKINKSTCNADEIISEEDKILKEKIDNGEAINNTIITKEQIEKISKEVKESNPNIVLTHVLDRGFDSNEIFELIKNKLKDQFVVRLKLSRNIGGQKILNAVFSHQEKMYFDKIEIKGTLYEQAYCVVEWGLELNNNSILKVQLFDRKKQPVFENPMFLITNIKITSEDFAFIIYKYYLQRAKIEGVFKFMKETLGWEKSQIRKFKAIKTLLSFCFFVTAYFYEIEDALIENDNIKFISYLGGGKGKVTKQFILNGLSKMLIKISVDLAIQNNKISGEQLKEIEELYSISV